jgi:ABC-type polysaccharide/polyol phosphate transport system ATPase subunit
MNALEISNLSKSFRVPEYRRETIREHVLSCFRPTHYRANPVLQAINFHVALGETLGIMGRNGCGKSTLLRILAGIYQPDSGAVIRHGGITPILGLGVGWNFELDALDNIELMGTAMGSSLRDLRRKREAILDFGGLTSFARLQLKHYSNGMAARLAYAVAFHAVREILLLDEILAVGDADFRLRCYERFRQFHQQGHTVILVSHNPSEIAQFCDRALLLEQGRIHTCGTGAEVADAYSKLWTT